jgi:hypothetical protein
MKESREPSVPSRINTVRDVSSSLVLIQHWKPPAPRR